MAESSPVVARWELSRRLAARRKELGVDVKTITDTLGFTRNYWSAVENDRTLIAEDKLRLLFDLLDFPDQDRTELLTLREDSRKKGWWDEYPFLSDTYKRFYGLEHGASRIRTYDGLLLPGLLQIEAYAQAVIAADPSFSPVETQAALEIRQRRQAILDRRDHVKIEVLLTEAALRQCIAGPATQIEQIDRIANVHKSRSNAVEVFVLALEDNPGIIANSSTLVFFQYATDGLPELAWQESVRPLDTLEFGEDEYLRLELAWRDGATRSRRGEEVTKILDSVREDLARTS